MRFPLHSDDPENTRYQKTPAAGQVCEEYVFGFL